MIDFYLISVVVFALALAVIFYKDRKNVRRESILLIRRTRKGKDMLIRIGTRLPRFWKILGVIGVIAGFLVSSYTFIWLLGNSVKIILAEDVGASFMFVLPSASSEANIGPGYLSVPFWYWIISIALLVVVHEGLHGIMAAREKVKIKSLGWGLLALIPLAFVEPDEEQLRKQPGWSQLRVFAAGSFSNFMLAGLVVIIASISFTGMFIASGVGYQGLIAGYPAAEVNLTGTIVRINDYSIRDASDLSLALTEIGPNKTITVYTISGDEEKSFSLTTYTEPEPVYQPDSWTGFAAGLEHIIPGTLDFIEWASGFESNSWATAKYEISFWEYIEENYPGLQAKASQRIDALEQELGSYQRSGFIGISSVINESEIDDKYAAYSGIIDFLSGLFFFVILINIGVGIANLLPIKPLDGGRMWEILFQKVFPPRLAGSVTKAVSSFTLLILILNFVVPILM